MTPLQGIQLLWFVKSNRGCGINTAFFEVCPFARGENAFHPREFCGRALASCEAAKDSWRLHGAQQPSQAKHQLLAKQIVQQNKSFVDIPINALGVFPVRRGEGGGDCAGLAGLAVSLVRLQYVSWEPQAKKNTEEIEVLHKAQQ